MFAHGRVSACFLEETHVASASALASHRASSGFAWSVQADQNNSSTAQPQSTVMGVK